MKVAAITITYNRLELTKQTLESFYSRTGVDYHVIVDNGSTDGTQEYIKGHFPHIFLDKNYGITEAFCMAAKQLTDYDFILKLDNDVQTVTMNLIIEAIWFYQVNGPKFVVSPIDLNIDPKFAPKILSEGKTGGFKTRYVTHTGGAFQLIPNEICQRLVKDYNHFKQGDMAIGKFYRHHGYKPVYLTDLEMRHIGINQTSPNYIL